MTQATVDDANVFICQACDETKGGVAHGDTHKATHNLVRCLDPDDEDDESDDGRKDSTESRVAALEIQMSALAAQMDRIEKLLLQSLAPGRPDSTAAS